MSTEPIAIVIDSKILFLTFDVLDYEFNVKSTSFLIQHLV